MVSNTWKKLERNMVLHPTGEGDYFVSYNPKTGKDTSIATEIVNALGLDVKDGEETALVRSDDGLSEGSSRYCILSGDFREQYEAIIDNGWDACYEFFLSQKDAHGNNWSTYDEDRPSGK